MNPPPDERKAASHRTGRVFPVLFGIVVLLGLGFGAMVVWGPADGPCKKLYSQALARVQKLTKSKSMLSKVGSGPTVTCRGVTLDVNNLPLAIMDDQTVGIGQTHNGVKIIDITSGYVMVEYNGETRRLALGEKIILE